MRSAMPSMIVTSISSHASGAGRATLLIVALFEPTAFLSLPHHASREKPDAANSRFRGGHIDGPARLPRARRRVFPRWRLGDHCRDLAGPSPGRPERCRPARLWATRPWTSDRRDLPDRSRVRSRLLGGLVHIAGLTTAQHARGRSWWRGLGMLGDASVYLVFMIDVAGIALGLWRGGGDRNVQSWIAWLSVWDYGRLLIGIIGAAVLVGGAGLLVWGIVGDVDREVALPQREKRLIRPVARYGIAGRGAAVALVGWFLLAGALSGNPRECAELGGVLAALRQVTYGRVLIGLFGLAFIGSSLFDFVAAFYRRFDPADA